jgi:putative membrane protein
MRDDSMRDRLALPVIGLVSTLVVLSVWFLLLGRQTQVQRGYGVSALPTLNAFLNGTSAVLLTVGYIFIRLKKVTAHKTCMVTALGMSSLFLISYLIHHYRVGSVPFEGTGFMRPVYFTLLIGSMSRSPG